jgi:putative PIN family toxin of toxin-antitoxin system
MLVLDTNVVVAALASRRGASHWLVNGALTGEVEIAISVALALEYEAVLKRARLRELSWATEEEVDAILDALLATATLASPIRVRIRPAANDPADDMVLECALTAGADAIVSLNVRDLADASRRHGLRLLSPAEAVRELKRKDERT